MDSGKKQAAPNEAERKLLERSYLGKSVEVDIDRPIGYVHIKGSKTLHYPINYGYLPGIIGGDGEELDVYILGVETPLEHFSGRVIAIVHRINADEDKLVAAPFGMNFTEKQIIEAVHFQEKYYSTYIELCNG